MSKDELHILKKVVNNSIVGVSKLLHFISPEVYTIWDSRVASYLEVKDINNVQNFCNYLEYCHVVSPISGTSQNVTLNQIHLS